MSTLADRMRYEETVIKPLCKELADRDIGDMPDELLFSLHTAMREWRRLLDEEDYDYPVRHVPGDPK